MNAVAAPLQFEQATPFGVRRDNCTAAEAYAMLTGRDPADAVIATDDAFDTHVLASILAVAISEDGRLAERAGLDPADLAELLRQRFPISAHAVTGWCACEVVAIDDEVAMLSELLLSHRSTAGDESRWLASMVARRAMESSHLWEDLGLRDRSELSRLLGRHFAPLAARNTRDMRWKRFFYRMLCEDDGLVMCTTPVCAHCADFDMCFGDESGESRMADRRRAVALQAAAPVALRDIAAK
jgi:nitrogen fixation protein NifQ